MAMQVAEDATAGLKVCRTDRDRFTYARATFSAEQGQWTPASVLSIQEYQTWWTKREAVAAAKANGYPAWSVERLGTRFCRLWGIRHDPRENYFLANF